MILELRLEENVIQEVISNPNVPFLALPIKAGTRAALCQSQRKGLASFGNVSPVFSTKQGEKIRAMSHLKSWVYQQRSDLLFFLHNTH